MRRRQKGYTLIEVVLAILVVTISVSATLVVMNKMVGYTAVRGYTMDRINAITVSQYVLDQIRDQRFPPTSRCGSLNGAADFTGTMPMHGTVYNFTTSIRAFDSAVPGNRSEITTLEYDAASGSDALAGQRNLLEVTVEVSRNSQLILRTVTYKTRNGYY